jgi:hypothetical protein
VVTSGIRRQLWQRRGRVTTMFMVSHTGMQVQTNHISACPNWQYSVSSPCSAFFQSTSYFLPKDFQKLLLADVAGTISSDTWLQNNLLRSFQRRGPLTTLLRGRLPRSCLSEMVLSTCFESQICLAILTIDLNSSLVSLYLNSASFSPALRLYLDHSSGNRCLLHFSPSS